MSHLCVIARWVEFEKSHSALLCTYLELPNYMHRALIGLFSDINSGKYETPIVPV